MQTIALQKHVSAQKLADEVRRYQRNADKIFKKEDMDMEDALTISDILDCGLPEMISQQYLSHLPSMGLQKENYSIALNKTGHYTIVSPVFPNRINIGKRIREIAERKGWNEREMGKRLGITQSNVSCLYRRERITVKRLIEISRVLGVNLIEEVYLSPRRMVALRNKIVECTITFNEHELRIEHPKDPNFLVEFSRKHC